MAVERELKENVKDELARAFAEFGSTDEKDTEFIDALKETKRISRGAMLDVPAYSKYFAECARSILKKENHEWLHKSTAEREVAHEWFQLVEEKSKQIQPPYYAATLGSGE